MMSRQIGVFALVAFMAQGSISAQAACQSVQGMVCGAGGGALGRVHGDVSLGRGAGVTPIASGQSLAAGDRILAADGGASVSLGGSCSVAIPSNSVSTVSSVNGMTCVQAPLADPNDEKYLGQLEPGGLSPFLVPIVVGGVTAAIGVAIIQNTNHSVSP
jgi:hypothetical protein